MKKSFLQEIVLLRAFTIVTIVTIHFFDLTLFSKNVLDNTEISFNLQILFTRACILFTRGNSSIFVFISGFLFYHVFYKKGFNYKQFFLSKLKNCFIPYLITVLFFCIIQGFITPVILKSFNFRFPDFISFFQQTFYYGALWYIPFIMLVFFLSPMFITFIETNKKTQILFLTIFSLVSFFVGRGINYNPARSLIYFCSFYLWGIYISINYDYFLSLRKIFWLGIGILFSVLTIFMLSRNYLSEQRYIVSYGYISKLLYTLLLLRFFNLYTQKTSFGNTLYFHIANYSFSLYFAHNYFLYAYDITAKWLKIFTPIRLREQFLYTVVLVTVTCLITLTIAPILKKFFGKYSKMIIGA